MAKNTVVAVVVLALATLAGCAAQRTPGPEVAPASEQTPMELRQRQLIVTLKPTGPESWVRNQQSRAIARDHGLRQIDDFPLQSIGVQCVVYEVSEAQAGEPRTLDAIVEGLAGDPRVESAQRNQSFQSLAERSAAAVSQSEYAKLQYALMNMGVDRAQRWSTGKGVRVAVIDTGMDTGHKDLSGQVATRRSFVQDGDRVFASDAHGTAVGGVIAARANDVGIVGVAPDADLIALKACWYPQSSDDASSTGQARCSSWSLAMAMDFAVRSDARVINLSLSGPPDQLLTRLIENAAHQGRVVVAAATSTEAGEQSFPASLDTVVGVVSSDIDDRLEAIGWRARGKLLAAPGVEILTTAPGQAYGFQSGSSLAAAHVSGVLALMFQSAPTLDATRATRLLQATTRPLVLPAGSSAATVGLVDACAALNALGACG